MDRLAVPLLVCVASVGCASTLQRSVEAYERGDFRAAHELLGRVEPGEGGDVRAAVGAGIEYSTSYLLSQAWVALERGHGAKLREALAYYRAALAVMPEDHSRRPATMASVAEVEGEIALVRARHRTALARFGRAASERDYAGAITAVGELLHLMRAAGVRDPSASDVLALAEQAMGDGRHDVAVELVELADLVRREAQARVADDLGEIARVAAALRYFHRLAEAEAGSSVARRSGRRRSSATRKSEARRPSATDSAELVVEKEARSHLQRARERWSSGKRYDALRILDDAIAMLGGRFGLGEQEKRWRPARTSLIADYVDRGELALSREASTEARSWYERILALDPAHELARDRVRKLDKLLELQSSGNR